jgi:hypothetical protein
MESHSGSQNMELWQWVAFEGGEFKTWMGAAEHPLGARGLCQVGAPVFAAGLVYPLVFAIEEKHLGELSAPRVPGPFTLRFGLCKDDVTQENLCEPQMSSLKTMAILSEFAVALAESAEAAGLEFINFHSACSQLKIAFDTSSCDNLGEQVRGLVLLRASLEILACVRGFAVRNLRVHRHVDENGIEIDSQLATRLKSFS